MEQQVNVYGGLVSVIVPIFNIEKYVCKCVDSILAQSYKNIEIILVDDGSSDSSPMICDDYARKYKNIVVIHKENGGLSDARNVGNKIAKGDYISYVDGDDYIDENFILNLVKGIERSNADIAVAMIYRDNNSFVEILDKNRFHNNKTLSKNEAIRYLASEGKMTTCAWDKLYRRKLMPFLFFPKGKLFEDKYIMHKIFASCEKIEIVPEAIYYYVTRSGSITNGKFNPKMLDNLDAANKRLEYYEENYPRFAKHVRANRCDIAINLYILSRHDKTGKEFRKDIIQTLRRDFFSFIFEKDYSSYDKLKKICRYIVFRIGIFDIYRFMRRFVK